MVQARPLQEITHEARGSLSVIQLTAEALLAKAEGSREELESILQQVDKLAEILGELSSAKK